MDELPNLTGKENECLMCYLTNGFKKTEAFESAYDCSNMSKNTIYVEASRFFNNPKITPWLKKFQANTQKTVQDELNYQALNHFEELNEMKQLAMKCRDKNSNPNVAIALKAVELKGRLAGLYKDNIETASGNVVNVMGSITLDGKKLEFNVGEAVNNEQSETSKNS